MLRAVKFKGTPLTLVGRILREGAIAANFEATTQDSKEITLKDFGEKIKIITFFLSLDTSVCDLQVKEFNKRAAGLSSEVVIIGISKDLPFAQKRFCADNNIKNVLVISDYRTSSFGINYGLLIKETNLLARGIIILDKKNTVRYIQICQELSNPPDYDSALAKLEEVIENPVIQVTEQAPSGCKSCEGAIASLPKDTVGKLIAQYRGWELVDGKKIVKEFKFKDFTEAKYFLDLVFFISREQGHHPNFTLIYNKLRITLTTHSAGGLTENDFIMAKLIDESGE